jgi:hypothetical protein
MLKAFKYGFSIGIQQWRIAAIVYFFQFCIALTLGMQVYHVMESSIGNSLEINKLLTGYDHTVITDFLKVHGASITPLIGQLRWLLLVWLIFSVFIDAGLMFCATHPEQAKGRIFFQSAATYFFSFLKIALIFLVLLLVWTGVSLLPVLGFFQRSVEVFPTEVYSVWMILTALFIWFIGVVVLFIWSVNSRIIKIKTGGMIRQCIQQGRSVFGKNKVKMLGLVLSFVLLFAVTTAVYLSLDAHLGMRSGILIFIMFLVQQVFVFFRVQMRTMAYAGISQIQPNTNL